MIHNSSAEPPGEKLTLFAESVFFSPAAYFSPQDRASSRHMLNLATIGAERMADYIRAQQVNANPAETDKPC